MFPSIFQLRKAIEDVNSGNLTSSQSVSEMLNKKDPISVQEVPLLNSKHDTNVDDGSDVEAALAAPTSAAPECK